MRFGDRFFLRIICTYIPEANATLAVVGHHPHQERECHKHEHSQQHSIREVRGPARTRATYNTSEGRQRVSPHTPRPSGLDPANSGHRRHAQAKSSVHPSSVSFSREVKTLKSSSSALCRSRHCLHKTCAKRAIHMIGIGRKEVRVFAVVVVSGTKGWKLSLAHLSECLSVALLPALQRRARVRRSCTKLSVVSLHLASVSASCRKAASVASAAAAPRQHFLQTNACP